MIRVGLINIHHRLSQHSMSGRILRSRSFIPESEENERPAVGIYQRLAFHSHI